MRWWHELKYVLRRLDRRRAEEEMEEELRAHLELEIEQNVEAGMSPGEARHAALRAFGNKGSRLLVTLSVNKNPFAQINYGMGKDVSDEDISDTREPLRVEWRNDSYVKIPVWR